MADPLTAEQREVWDEVGMDDRPTRPSAGQTLEQAMNFRALSFRYICGFEGVEAPSEEAVLEALHAIGSAPR